jgi:phosphate transport system permease protein
MANTISILHSKKTKTRIERIMKVIFVACGFITVVSVILISLYMIFLGGPAIAKIGPINFLFGQVWDPQNNQYGILMFILASIIATFSAVLIAAPIGILVAIFLSRIANNKVAAIVRPAVELLSGIPSVVYGLLGAILIVPIIFNIQEAFGMQTSGSLLAAIIVLVIMILPTIISVSEVSIRAIPHQYNEAALALGASKMQSIMKVIVPAAKSGIVAGLVLGTGRAIGETMAVLMVAGNSPVMPELLKSVRLMTVGISIEWAYSSGMQREALYGIGLVLFIFIMVINFIMNATLKKEVKD